MFTGGIGLTALMLSNTKHRPVEEVLTLEWREEGLAEVELTLH